MSSGLEEHRLDGRSPDAPLTTPEIDQQAGILRAALEGLPGISEKRMFGGLCFLLNGHMLCGSWKHGGMVRVGKTLEAEALAVDGTGPMTATGRRMSGLIEVSSAALADADRRGRLLALALDFVGALPPKPDKPTRRR